jgi:integration host factor subunit beta
MDPPFRRAKCMTKAELVEKVADKIQLTKKQTEAVVNILLNCITEALSEGDKVELRGFGSFRIRNRNPREGRNPKTGDTVQIPAKRVPFFKAGKELREMVDGQ